MMPNRSHQIHGFVRKGFDWRWLIYGGAGLVLAIVGHEWGLFEGVSWGVVVFFLLYTIALFFYFGKQTATSAVGSWRPNGLSRLRSYLTFLPITHIIQQGDGTKELGDIHAKTQADDNELSLRIGIQKDLVIEAILAEYIAPWYNKISSNTDFLQKCRIILQSIFHQVGEKLRQVDRNEIAKEAIQTVHMHWKEYCKATLKSSSDGESIIKCFKFVHPYLQDKIEVSQKYEKLICQLLEDLVIPELQSTLLCQFLSGIIVKSFFLYYTDVLCQPCLINSNLIVLLSSDSILAELAGCSSQNSSAPPTPLPDRSPKNIIDGNGSSAITSPTATPSSDQPPGSTPPQKLFQDASQENGNDEMRFIFGRKEMQDLDATSGLEDYLDRMKISTDTPSRCGSRSSPSPSSTSVSSALNGIISTTAFPLLPSASYSMMIDSNSSLSSILKEDASVLSVDAINCYRGMNDSNTTQSSFLTEKEDLETTFSIAMTEPNHHKEDDHGHPSLSSFVNCDKDETSSTFKATTPTHYFSFEEVSTRKSSHPVMDATLSVDGALDNRKKAESINKGSSNTHELKIVNDIDVKNGRSPVYEEPEDFATSIAKLRSLLEQKESKKNLHVGSSTGGGSHTHESGIGSPIHGGNSREDQLLIAGNDELVKDLTYYHDDLHDTNVFPHDHDDDDDNDDVEVPELKCYFLNITIPKVESYNDSGGQFDFYCIQYEGVYFDEKYEGQPLRVILRTTTVKRRFKEFLLLQSKLEEQSQWKPHLKGIKAPNRWLNLSFSKADAATTRKTNLERYLNQICSHPVLGTTREVLQFMAYGDEGFSLDPLDINDPKHLLSNKLDKLAKKFTCVLNSLKDALPSFESNPPSPHSENGVRIIQTPSSFQFKEEQQSPEINRIEKLENSLDATWLDNLVPSMTSESDINASISKNETDTKFPNVTVKISDVSPDDISDDDNGSYIAYPLAASLTQLLCDVLWLPNCRPHNASVSTFMSLSGKSLENYVHETIDVFLSDEAVLGYLEWFAKSLKADMESVQDLQYDLCTELDLKNCLRKRIPAWVRWMWGRNRLDVTIERITGFFQNPIINQDLVLSLSELLFSKITPIHSIQ